MNLIHATTITLALVSLALTASLVLGCDHPPEAKPPATPLTSAEKRWVRGCQQHIGPGVAADWHMSRCLQSITIMRDKGLAPTETTTP